MENKADNAECLKLDSEVSTLVISTKGMPLKAIN